MTPRTPRSPDWDGIESGRTTAVVGATPGPPPAGWRVLRVACRARSAPLAPIAEARRRIDALSGSGSLLDLATNRVRSGLRRRFLGEADRQDAAWPLVEPLNRFARGGEGHAAFVFEAVEQADDATLALLEEVVTHPVRLGLALVLVFGARPTRPAASRLLAAVQGVEGPAGLMALTAGPATLMELRAVPRPVTSPAARLPTRSPPPQPPPAAPGAAVWSPLPLVVDADTRLVLRAAALLGEEVDSALLARLLDRPVLRVLEALQLAADAGTAVEDLGGGAFAMPAALVGALIEETSPSLRAGWQARLDALAEPTPPHLDLRSRLDPAAETEPGAPLQSALATLEAAQAQLPSDAAPLVRAELRQAIAEVCYDLGDPASLERALSELSEAVRLLSSAQLPLDAARLLNDQAAVYVRLGDPLRGAALLRQSREVFEGADQALPSVRMELAETDHLLARLPLHVAARAGQEHEALRRGLGHAEAASTRYAELGAVSRQAHVWETMGRLRVLLGDLDGARDVLMRAFAAQEGQSDALAMARTTAALAELKLAEGEVVDAAAYLSESVRLNRAKGAARGLEYNREMLERLQRLVPPALAIRLEPTLRSLARALLPLLMLVLARPAFADVAVDPRFSYQRSSDFFVTGATMAIDTDGDSNVDRAVDPAGVTVGGGDIPAGMGLQQALLYWSGSIPDGGNDCGPGAPIDTEVVVTPPLQAATPVTADVCYCSAAGAASYDVQACRADVTAIANGQMFGTWAVGEFSALIDDGSTNNASFALILIYGGPGLPARQITVYDGLLTMSNNALSLTLGGIEIDDPPSGDLTWYTLEGDPGGNGAEQVTVTGAPGGQPLVLADGINPAENPMNRTINTTSPTQTGVSGVDIDGFDITNALAAGDSGLVVDYGAGSDKWWIVFNIVGVNVFFPSFAENSSKTWVTTLDADSSGGPSPGDHVRYAISLVNSGAGAAVVDVQDPISPSFSSWTLVDAAGGSDASTTDTLQVTGIPVGAGGLAQVVFDAVIGDVPNATVIENVASWSVPENGSTGLLTAPTMQIEVLATGDDDDDDSADDDDDDSADDDDDDSTPLGDDDDDSAAPPPGWTPRQGDCACAADLRGVQAGDLRSLAPLFALVPLLALARRRR